MRLFSKLFISFVSVLVLSGCIGEKYDFSPPTITLLESNIELIDANINWNSDQQYRKEIEDIIQLAKEQSLVVVKAGREEELIFDSQDFEIKELSVFVWLNGQQTKLEMKDEKTFYFPTVTGEYVLEVYLKSEKGTAQYVANILVM